MSSRSITADQANTERVILLDRINVLVMFDETGKDCEEAMALMARHNIGADELNARRNSRNRPFYIPINRKR